MRCDDAASALADLVDGTDLPQGPESAHIERCLRCQAELAQYRKLLRAMHLLRTDVGAVPDGLVGTILAHVESAGERSAVRATLSGRRVAYLGGIAAAATAAGAGAAIVLVSRGRRGRLPLAG